MSEDETFQSLVRRWDPDLDLSREPQVLLASAANMMTSLWCFFVGQVKFPTVLTENTIRIHGKRRPIHVKILSHDLSKENKTLQACAAGPVKA